MEAALLVLLFISATVLIKNRQLVNHYIIGGLCFLPILLIDPLLRVGYFEQLSNWQLISHFGKQLIFIFLFGGLSVIIYELVFSPIFVHRRASSRHAMYVIFIGIITTLAILFLSSFPLVVAVIIGLAVNTFLLVIWRSDLLWDAIFSAIGTGLLYTILFTIIIRSPGAISGLWFTNNLSGLTIAGLPIEELLVISLFGAFFGPIYVAIKSRYEK